MVLLVAALVSSMLLGASGMTCGDLQTIYNYSPVNDGSASCCASGGSNTVVLYQSPCKTVRDLFRSNNCCNANLDAELPGFPKSCDVHRICTVNPPIANIACTNRICQARS